MSRVFVTRRIPDAGLCVLRDAGIELQIGQHDEERGLDREALLDGVRACDVLLCLLTESIDREVLTANRRLRGVAQMAVGVDNVDVAAATSLGIPVANTPGVLTDATADLTWALLLAAARRIPEAHAYTAAGRWRLWGPNLLLGTGVGPSPDGARKTLGIVGFGRIGRAVARRAAGFDMRVLATGTARSRADVEAAAGVEWASLEALLAASDFVTLHVPLNAATEHLIGARELAAMKRGAVLVNTSRGPVVDERALVEALREHVIGGAALDVYEDEPQLATGLTELSNVVLLPHIGSATRETRDRMAVLAADAAVAFVHGERPAHCVNPEVYEGRA